tara:strand:- start:3025 stop:3411 length:387 start_codon:yes stop_codon:yes gene_type:complete
MAATIHVFPAEAAGGKMGEGDLHTANVSGSITIDFSDGYYQELTLTNNVTAIAFSSVPANEGRSVVVDFVQPSSGSVFTVAFGGIKFDSGIAPTVSTGNSDRDRVAFDVINDGSSTTKYGHVLGLDMQ